MSDYSYDGDRDRADLAELRKYFADSGPTGVYPSFRIFGFQPDAGVDLDDLAEHQSAMTDL